MTGLTNPPPGAVFAIKLADEIRNNTDVLADDSALSLPVEANAVYEGQIMLLTKSATNTPDVAFQMVGPVGAALHQPCLMYDAALTLGVNAVNLTVPMVIGAAVFFLAVLRSSGLVITGAAAGTLKIQWAQSIATIEDTVMGKGSFISLRRLA